MRSKQKYVAVGIIVLSVLTAMILSRGFAWVVEYAGLSSPVVLGMNQLPLTAVVAYALSIGAGFFCYRNEAISTLANEVVDELSKVTWPTREETGQATVVVIVTVFICSAFLGLFDAVWLWLTDRILGIGDS